MDVRTNVKFKMLLENYGNKRYRIKRNQTVVHIMPQLRRVITTTVNLAEVMGLRDNTYRDLYQEETQAVFTTARKEDPEGPQDNNN